MSRKNKYLILLPLMLAGCRSATDINIPFIPGLGPHKIDIQQGNVISEDMLQKLQPGMTRSQVRFVLGTPLLVDPFRSDRWDYIYSLNKKGDRIEQRQLKVYFKDDRMVRYEGDIPLDVIPGGKPVADKPSAKPAPVKPAATPVPVQPQAAPAAAEVAKPAPAAPAREAGAAENAKPQLRMSPSEGEPAKPEVREQAAPPVAAPAAKPAAPEPLEAPPLPRLVLPPEPEDKPGPSATTPDTPAR